MGYAIPKRSLSVRAAVVGLLLCALVGCRSTQWATLRKTPHDPFSDQLAALTTFSSSGAQASKRTMQVVRSNGLEKLLEKDPRAAIIQLRESLERDPSAEKLYAVAELTFIRGKELESSEPDQALAMFAATTVFAYQHLFGEQYGQLRNPYDPEFRGACDLYNGGLEGALRIAKKRGLLNPGSTEALNAADHKIELTIVLRGSHWDADDFEKFEFASDYEIKGLPNQYRTYGLGVPLIAVRKNQVSQRPADKFLPPGMSVPMTAFLRLSPNDSPKSAIHQAVLELYDPLDATDINVAGKPVPLETDLTTPLAYSLDQPALKHLDSSTDGLLHPESLKEKGIFMLDPYQPGKIPVLMVHGLWSSPGTWMEMFNDLRSEPDLRDRYQFWFYLYASGEPFWFSAARLRADLAKVRQTIDPNHQDLALDRMVLVGHSMGGLVSRMQTLESGDQFWQTVCKESLDSVKAKEEIKSGLAQTFYFHPNQSVECVVTIGTPHRGSSFVNETTRYLSSKLIKPAMLITGSQQLRMQNPNIFLKGAPIDIFTSIDSLAPTSPLLPIILSAQASPKVRHHNIVGKVERSSFLKPFTEEGDGVVGLKSAHLDNVASELIVEADHMHVHRHPLSVLKVRRILLDHAGVGAPPEQQWEGGSSIVGVPAPPLPVANGAAVMPGATAQAVPLMPTSSVQPTHQGQPTYPAQQTPTNGPSGMPLPPPEVAERPGIDPPVRQ